MSYFDEFRKKYSDDFNTDYDNKAAAFQIKQQQKEKEIREYNNRIKNDFNSSLETPTTNSGATAPDEVFGKESWDYFKKMHPDTPDGFFSGLGYVLETPYRIPVLNRFLDGAAKSFGGEKAIAKNSPLEGYSKDTGSKIINKLADMGGTMAGLASVNTGTPGQNLLNFGDDIAAKVGGKVTEKIGNNVAGRILGGAARGAADNAMGNMADDIRFNNGDDLLGSAAEGALGGALFGGAFKGVSEGARGVKNLSDKFIDNAFESTSQRRYEPDIDGLNKMDIKNPLSDGLTPKTTKSITENPINKTSMVKPTENISYNSNVPLAERSFDNAKKSISSKKTNAISYDYPELQPYIQREAEGVLNSLRLDNIEGKKFYNYDNYTGDFQVIGQKNVADPTIKEMQNLGMSYKDIRKGLNDIIEDHGKENNATAKKVELVLDKNLTDGSVNVRGEDLPSNNDYIDMKKDIISLENGDLSVFGLDKAQDGIKVNNFPKKQRSIGLDFDSEPGVDDGFTLDIDPTEFGVKMPGPGEDYNMTKFNTFRNSEFMSDPDIQKVVEDVADFHQVKTNKASMERATKSLMEDYEGTVNRLKESGIQGAEDVAASGLITKDLIKQAQETGDYTALREWLDQVNKEGTKAGQTLQAFRTWKNITPEGTLNRVESITENAKNKIKKSNPDTFKAMENELNNAKASGDKEMVKEIMKKYDVPYWDDAEISNLISKSEEIQKMPEGREKDIAIAELKKSIVDNIPATRTDILSSMQRMNLLLNLKTMTRNVLGNVFMGAAENVKDIPGALIDKGISKITGQRTTLMPDLDSLKTQGKGLVEGFQNSLDDYKRGIDTSLSQGQYELPSGKAFKGEGFGKSSTVKKLTKPVDKVLSKAEDVTSFGLKLGDNPFYTAAYNDALRQQKKIKGTDKITDEMKEFAKGVAEHRTFQNNSNIATGMKGIQNAINRRKLGDDPKFGFGSIILPFVKTPANILDKAIDYSPIGGALGVRKLIKNLKKPETLAMSQKEIVDKLGRSLTGTALIGLGIKLYDEGLINGSGASDGEAASLEKQAGKMPYSIKIGDTYNSIDWIQPAAIPLMIGADIAKAKKENKSSGETGSMLGDLLENISNAVTKGGATVFDQSLLTGIADLFTGNSQSKGENFMKGLGNSVANAAQQFVPFNSALKSINDVVDPVSRDTYDSDFIQRNINQVKSKVPGLSTSLPEKVDTLGNTQQKFYGDGLLKMFNSLINPGKTSIFSPTNAEKVALDLYNKSGETIQMPRYAPKNITYTNSSGKKQTLALSGEDKNTLQRIMGKATESAYSHLPANFSGMSDDKKAQYLQKILTEINQKSKEELLRKKGISFKKSR